MTVTIALGSNLGDRTDILARARQLVVERIGPILADSSLVNTPAWGMTEQPDFLNQVVVVSYQEQHTDLPLSARLHRLLDLSQSIETDLGRERKTHWGPRTCDLDLIFVDDLAYEDERLSLPHPWWSARDFVGGIIRRELACLLDGNGTITAPSTHTAPAAAAGNF